MKELDIFEKMPVPKAVAALAVPTVASSLVFVLYNLADTYFVSALNNPIQNAAVSLTSPLLLAFYSISNLFGVGTSSEMSRALGRKEYNLTRHCAAFGFYGALILSALYSLTALVFPNQVVTFLGADSENFVATLEYMFWTIGCGTIPAILGLVLSYMIRAEGKSLQASIGAMGGCILNIILDPFFVLPWGFNMGAAGAGLATFLSNSASCIYFFILIAVERNNTYVSLNPRNVRIPKKALTSIFVVGIPAMIQNILNVSSLTILNIFTAAYGSAAVAAMGIAQKIYFIALQVTYGLTDGVMPLIGYNYSSGNIKRMKNVIFFSGKIALLLQFTLMLLYIFGASALIRLFMTNTEVVTYGTYFLQGLGFALPFTCLDYLCVGIFQACGKGLVALVFALLRKIVLEIPALYVISQYFSIYALCYATVFSEFILAVVGTISVIYFFKKLKERRTEVLN